eukprot:8768568-Pyramimonas_sp.AAC.1
MDTCRRSRSFNIYRQMIRQPTCRATYANEVRVLGLLSGGLADTIAVVGPKAEVPPVQALAGTFAPQV